MDDARRRAAAWMRALVLFAAIGVLAACSASERPPLVGTLEWDRASVLSEVSEPIIEIAANEGQTVAQGALILRLDPRRTDAQLSDATAQVNQARATLAERVKGARIEEIDARRADLARAESAADNAKRTRDRAAEVRRQGLVAQATLDDAENALRVAQASSKSARAQLAELLHGTRPEQIAAAEAALTSAEARAEQLRLTRERLDVRAPQAGRLDALPYRLGDQPPVGAALVILLAGDAPYARVYVPEATRTSVKTGQKFRVLIDGSDSVAAHVRTVSSEAAFTPYYALSGDDASRLVYRAELVLEGAQARELPAGLPIRAELASDEAPAP